MISKPPAPMRRHEFSDLFVLLAVAETQSFTAAAEALETSQSNVSHAISRLERRVGQKLVLRGARGVEGLTPLGERLVEGLGPSLRTVRQVMSDVI